LLFWGKVSFSPLSKAAKTLSISPIFSFSLLSLSLSVFFTKKAS